MLGFVKWFSRTKGYGFIQADNGQDFFVHFSALKDQNNLPIDNTRVEFQIEQHFKGPRAIGVKVIENEKE